MNRKLKKTISGVLIAGILTGGMSGVAFAEDNAAASVQTKQLQQAERVMGRGHNLLAVENLQEKISGLSADVQAEILALAKQLEDVQPAKPEQSEKPALESGIKSEQQDILTQIQTIFADAGITLSAQPDMKEKPELPADAAERPELPADTDRELPSTTDKSDKKAGTDRNEKGKHTAITSQIQEQLSQLSAESQAAVQVLLDELQALQPTEKQQSSIDSAVQSTEQDSTQQIRETLLQLLKDNGITMEPSEKILPDKNEQVKNPAKTV